MKNTFILLAFLLGIVSLAQAQNVGVDVATPEQKLDVAGGIKVGTTSNGVAGSIRWDSGQLQFHDGTSWVGISANSDDQTFDVIQLSGTNLELSLENDGQATQIVDLSSLADNTDNQTIDIATLVGTNLQLSLEDDGQPTLIIDMSALANTDDQTIDLMTITSDILSLSLEADGQAPLTVDLTPYLDNTDEQQFDHLQLVGTDLQLSISNDGQAIQSVDLSTLAVDTDDQTIDVAQLTGTNLVLSLEDDGQPNVTVDMSSLANTDDQTIDVYNITADQLTLSLEDDGQAPLTVDLTPYKDNTDNQQLDLLQLNGTTLEVSLEDDGQAPQTVDLSVFDDNTDDQTFDVIQLTGTNLELSLEDDGQSTHVIDLSVFDNNTDDQTIDVFSLTGTDLNLSLEDDGTPTQIVDLSTLKTSLTDADEDTKVEVEANPDEDIIRFTSAAAERMTILADGKVGIGTTAPDNTLTIAGSPSATLPALGINSGNEQATFNNGAQIAFGYNNTDEYQHFVHTRHNQLAALNNSIDFYVHSGNVQNNTLTSGSTHVMSLNAGNVGVGVTTPLNKLHVDGTGRFNTLAGGGNRLVLTNNTGDLYASNDIPGGDADYIHNQNSSDQAANFRINGTGEAFVYKLNSPDGEKLQFTSAGANGSKIRHTSGWAIDYHAGPGNSTTTGSHRFYTTAQTTYRERMAIESTGRIHIRQDIGNDPVFTGLESPESADGRAQLILSSSYSDLVIASRQNNQNHGSTLTFATYNPGNANDYRKFVINQGNWGNRRGFLDFGYSDAGGRTNPHANINATDNVVTMDGFNKRLGLGTMSPANTLQVNRTSTDNRAVAQFTSPGNNSWGQVMLLRTTGAGTDGAKLLFRSRNAKNWSVGGESNGNAFTINEDGGDGQYGTGFGTSRLFVQEGGFVGLNTTAPSGRLHVNNTDDSDMYYTTTGNLYVNNPESFSGTVRLGAAWNKPGIYVNPNLYLNSEGSVIINDNNQENWRFDGDNLISNNWGRIYTTDNNFHLDAGPGDGMYLNWYAGSSLYIGRGNSSARALVNGDGMYLYDGWFRTHGNNGFYFQDGGTGIHRVQADGGYGSSGQYGSVSTHGGVNGWEGYSIAGRYVWMGSGNAVGLYNDVDNRWLIYCDRGASNNGFQFANSVNGFLNMRIQHTNGTRYASYDGDSNWDFYSDRRLKENIENEENILDRLVKLDVVKYHFIGEDIEEKELGFIAQDVEQYFPSIVSETEDDRYDFKVKALGYSTFGVIAIGGIKELKLEKDQEIDGLNRTITDLKGEVEDLKNLVNKLLKERR